MSAHNIKTTIGVVVIAKNEAREIESFLANVLPWADEVIVVDDASTDETAALARAVDPAVIVIAGLRSPETGFAGLRNTGIARATAEWLLHMDVDERVTPNFVQEIREATLKGQHDAFGLRRRNFFMNRPMRGGGLQSWNQVHLARREGTRFEGIVHEHLVVPAGASIGQIKAPVWHLNDVNYLARMRKSDLYCSLVASQELARGNRGTAFDIVRRPVHCFVKRYILQYGCIDGIPGLIWALHSATAELRIATLKWEDGNPSGRAQVEAQLAKLWETNDQPTRPIHTAEQEGP